MRPHIFLQTVIAAAITSVAACANKQAHAASETASETTSATTAGATSSMQSHMHDTGGGTTVTVPNDTTLPADADHVLARLNSSPRHGEYVEISLGKGDSLRAWVVYPQRSTKAPVVLVIQEIFGLSPWIRGVADQLAAEGYIAIAPDLLSTQVEKPNGWPDNVSMQDGIAATSKLSSDSVQHWLDASAKYAMALPSALHTYGVVGFCWGGGQSFLHATHAPSLAAAVVYYGTPPNPTLLNAIHAPILGFYGGNDARVTSTVPSTDSAMKQLKKTFEPHIYDGAGHGFLRQQGGENGANLKATQQAWPATLAWFKQYLARDATSHR